MCGAWCGTRQSLLGGHDRHQEKPGENEKGLPWWWQRASWFIGHQESGVLKMWTVNLDCLGLNTDSALNVYGSFIHDSPKPKPTQVSIDWGVDKKVLVYPHTHSRILFSNKKWYTDTYITIWMNLKCFMLIEGSQT